MPPSSTTPSHASKVIPIAVSTDKSPVAPPPGADARMVSLYEARQKIYPRSVSGFFNRWRWALVFLTQLLFYGLPWLEWGQRQMVLFDLGARRFYIFNLVLYPQDFIYLTGILVVSALSLFLFTAVAGRLWCGYACPQTVYTEIFMWLEKRIEGERSARIRRDASPWSFDTLWRKVTKNLLWLAVALWTGFTFVGYFTPIRSLGGDLVAGNASSWQSFWVFFYALATFGAAGYMRELVCKHMCPYARFQSAMFDKDTLIVTYDAERGEPRGARSKKADLSTLNLGACIGCNLCVQVCPTGIDIRNGLQYECIGCGLCVDACDSVMDKVQLPRGLIRFATQNGMENRWNQAQMLRRMLRPRVLIYTAITLAFCVGLAMSLAQRTPLKVNVIRDRASLARIVPGGQLENLYRLQVMNATEAPQHYRISATGLEGLTVAEEDRQLALAPTQSQWITVRARIPYGSAAPGAHTMAFIVSTEGQEPIAVREPSVFQVPNER